jgi:outer membrane protein TolC
MARFNILLDRAQNHPVFIPDTLAAEIFDENMALDTGLHKGNPMLGMIEYEMKAYAAREKMSEKMGFPMVGLGVGYSLVGTTGMSDSEMNGRDMVMPMVSVSIPVWRKKYRAQRHEASLLAESAEQQYQSVSNDLQTEHNEAIRTYRDALRRRELYKGQKELASNTLDLLRTRLSVSAAGLTDILRVQQQLLDYEIREVTALTDLNKAISMLKRIMASSLDELNLKNTQK